MPSNSEAYANFAFPKPISIKKEAKGISKIGKRTKERIKKNGTEGDMFREIWNERPHFCEICGDPIPEALPWCFSHNLPKGKYPMYRYLKDNITLVCGIDCHSENDRRNARRDAELILRYSGSPIYS